MTTHHDYSTATSSAIGMITSILGSYWTGIAQDIFKAFLMGLAGAFAGWLFNYVRVKLTKK